MAEEEIIIIEEEDAALGSEASFQEQHLDDEPSKTAPGSSKKKLIIISVVVVFILILVLALLLSSSEEKKYKKTIHLSDEQTLVSHENSVSSSQLEKMITRANLLYAQGDKEDALKLYKRIATYSESISYYNLGVAQLQEKNYKKAISSFDLAIKNKQNVCVSAINAAVASLELKDRDKFESYLSLAYAYLPDEASSPLYSYYYSLLNFYQDNYLEALSPLKHRNSDHYAITQNQLSAKIHLLFSSYHQAIADLEKEYHDDNAFSLGLLYAKLGDTVLAKRYLREAIAQGISPNKSQLALALVSLKAGQVHTAAKLLENITDMYPDEVYKHYPIETFLKASLFDVNQAQRNFHENIIHNPYTIYEILFYFAPYKIFNADKTISYIRKGNANIAIDNVKDASRYLNEGANLSKTNKELSSAIQLALNFKLHEANEKLKSLAKAYPRHSIVHYNLALNYAQLGELNLANKHFLRSYNLDAKNFLSGIFTMFTSKLLNRENEKFNRIIKDNLADAPRDEENNLYRALIHFKEGNLPATYAWSEENTKESPFNLAFQTLISTSLNKKEMAKHYVKTLTQQLPHDIVPHLLYIDTFYSGLESKMFAREAISHLKRQDFSMEDFYYGSFITQFLYTQYAQITGQLYPLKIKIEEKLSMEEKSPIGVIQALALVTIYTQNFEEAYTLYNQLIDQYKQQDSHTLFLAAIAATGAKHPSNAIALLELAKRKNPQHSESRYALGLLYLQVKNNEGAIVTFNHMQEKDFQSQYFNFRIKNPSKK